MVSDDGERCPPGQRTVWINCTRGVQQVTALEAVKKVLEDERKRTGSTEEGDCKDHVTVVSSLKKVNNTEEDYCDEQGWTYILISDTICGYEDEVIYMIIVICTNAVLHRLLS